MTPRARPPNAVKTLPLKLSTTPLVIARLRALAGTGLFGKSPTEVAEELLRAKLREIEVPDWATSDAKSARKRAR